MSALVLAVVLALAACGGGPETAPPADTGTPPGQGTPIPGGELSVQEAIDSTLEGPLAVKGYIVAPEGEPVRLCTALLESYPPQCGEPSLVVEGLDLSTVEGLITPTEPEYAHTSWTDAEVSLLGEVENGVVTISETSI
jgi:predicted small lipoprotein YifL